MATSTLSFFSFLLLWAHCSYCVVLVKDMVILHHELEVEIEGVRERHTATLLAFGEGADIGSLLRPQSAMARTVGIPAAIAAQVNSIHISCNYFCCSHGDSTRFQYCFGIGQSGGFTKITNFGLWKLNHFVDHVGERSLCGYSS